MDKDIERAYAQKYGAANIMNWLPEVRRVLAALPTEPETEALFTAWLQVTKAASTGNLYAGDSPMKSSASQRAAWAAASAEMEEQAKPVAK